MLTEFKRGATIPAGALPPLGPLRVAARREGEGLDETTPNDIAVVDVTPGATSPPWATSPPLAVRDLYGARGFEVPPAEPHLRSGRSDLAGRQGSLHSVGEGEGAATGSPGPEPFGGPGCGVGDGVGGHGAANARGDAEDDDDDAIDARDVRIEVGGTALQVPTGAAVEGVTGDGRGTDSSILPHEGAPSPATPPQEPLRFAQPVPGSPSVLSPAGGGTTTRKFASYADAVKGASVSHQETDVGARGAITGSSSASIEVARELGAEFEACGSEKGGSSTSAMASPRYDPVSDMAKALADTEESPKLSIRGIPQRALPLPAAEDAPDDVPISPLAPVRGGRKAWAHGGMSPVKWRGLEGAEGGGIGGSVESEGAMGAFVSMRSSLASERSGWVGYLSAEEDVV